MAGVPLNRVLVEEFNRLHGGALPPDTSLKDLYDNIHALRGKGTPRSALCLSGGGIRSASFALGILHGFAERGLLTRFTYLSTVSGGGYIGGWLSAWRKKTNDEAVERRKADPSVPESAADDAVLGELRERRLRGDPATDPNADYREAPEVQSLRAFSNYLTPKLGVMSADTWTLTALYIRNLLLNWLIYLPTFIGVLLVPWLALACLKWANTTDEHDHAWLIGIALVSLFLALCVSVRGRLGRDKKFRVSEHVYIVTMLIPTYVAAMFFSAFAAGPNHADCFRWWIAGATGVALYVAAAIVTVPDLGVRPHGSRSLRAIEWVVRMFVLWWPWGLAGGAAFVLIALGSEGVQSLIAWVGLDHGLRLLVIFGLGWVAVSIFLAEAVYLGVTSYWKKGDAEREWLARSSGWFIAMTLGWAGLAAAALYGGSVAHWLNTHLAADFSSWIAGGAGIGIGATVARIGKSAASALESADKVKKAGLKTGSLMALGSIAFLLSLAIIISSWLEPLVAWFGGLAPVTWSAGYLMHLLLADLGIKVALDVPVLTLAIAACFGVVFFISFFINVNRFSAHALYRNRLARAFLGSARGTAGRDSTTRDPFTDFDPEDNPRMSGLRADGRLFHVVNTALNVVAGDNNAWQERKAEPFVMTPLYSGNEYVGFVPTGEFGSSDGGVTVGTAIAISGAAASPNQGYHSSPLIGFIMTLFNVRLGWWLGNPRDPKIARLEGPTHGIWQVLGELFGMTNDRSKYVYLSDGGHFENLGLYEMVRRRCHFIVVSDGGCDPDCAFEDLGNAVRKIWIDLGVSIDFRKIDIRKRGFPRKNLYCALGVIRYPECRDDPDAVGYVLYIKPGFHNDGREPADVTAYALANVAFPHEATADQFFSESQLESYRSLGAYIVKTILGEKSSPDMSAPTEALRPYWANLQTYLSQLDPKRDRERLVRPIRRPYRPTFGF